MALHDKLSQPPKAQHGLPCSVGALLDRLEGAELEAFKTMLGAPGQRGWSATAIWQACLDEGHEIGLQSINRHRGGKCRCER